MKNLLLFLVATLLSSQAYAKTEQFTLKANTAYGEEGIFFKYVCVTRKSYELIAQI